MVLIRKVKIAPAIAIAEDKVRIIINATHDKANIFFIYTLSDIF
jgi:hypothetical protein